MSQSIDQRVVELQFDNENFERNAKESLSTLDKLKEKLSFKNAGEGLAELERKVAKFSMKPVEAAINVVTNKFTYLDNLVWNFYSRISNKLLDIAKSTTAAFTIDPIKSGFEEYETQMNAVQTILANTQSKGSTIEDVNKALDELNHYADLTIYNFTEMTRNIGTFTAAGIGLEDATAAIQGISNLAAVSGSNTQQASTAMYQLSQALSAGSLKLQDWNSVVNAGMGGEIFQNALKDTAREAGIAVDSIIEKAGTFRESLKEGWITSDVLTQTLKKMTVSGADEYLAKLTGISQDTISKMHEEAAASADVNAEFHKMAAELAKTGKVTEDQAYQLLNMSTTAQDAATKVKTFSQLMDTLKEAAQSGWTQTWNLIIGDFEQAKALFTEFSDIFSNLINESAESRNAIVAEAMGSNWEKLTSTLTDAGLSVDQFKETLVNNAKESGVAIDEWIEKDGSFEKTLSRGWLKDTDITKAFEDMSKGATAAGMSLEEYQKVVTDVVMGDYGNGAKRVRELTAANYDYAEIQALVNKCWNGSTLDLTKLDIAQLKNIGITEDQIEAYKKLAEESKNPSSALHQMISDMSMPSGRDMLIDTLRNTLKGILTITKSISTAFNKTFKPSASPIKKFLKTVDDLSKKFAGIEKYADRLTRTFSGLFSVFGILGDVLGVTLSFAFKLFGQNVNINAKSILDFTARIGDNIVAFRQWMKDTNAVGTALSKLKDNLLISVQWIKDFISGFDGLSGVDGILIKIQNGFKNLASRINIDFGSIALTFSNFIDNIKTGDKIDLSNIPSAKEDIQTELDGLNLSFDGFVKTIRDKLATGLSGVFSWLTNIFSGFTYEAKFWIEAIKKTFANLNWGVVLSIGNAAFITVAIDKITKSLSSLASQFTPLSGIFKSISGLTNVFKAQALQNKAEAILEIAAAIGLLSLSMVLLATIKPDDIVKTIGLLTAALVSIAAMAGVAYLINKNSSTMTGAFMTLLGIAISVELLSKTLTRLTGLIDEAVWGYGSFGDAVKALLSIMAVMAGSVFLMGVFGQNLSKASPFLISFAASVSLLAYALTKLADASRPLNAGVAVQLVGMIGAVALISKACEKVTISSGIGVLAISAGLLLLCKAFEELPKDNELKGWFKSLITLGAMSGMLASLLKIFGGEISQFAAKAGLGILGVVTAFTLMPVAIRLLGSINSEMLAKGLLAVAGLTILFKALIKSTADAGEFAAKSGLTLLAAAGSIIVLTAAVAAFGLMDTGPLIKGMACVALLEILFMKLVKATRFSRNAEKPIIAMTAVMVALTACLAILSSPLIEGPKMLMAAAAIDSVLLSMAALFTTVRKAGTEASKTIVPLLVLTGVVGLLSGFLIGVAALQTSLNIDVQIETFGSLSVLLVAMGGAMVLVSWAAKLAGGGAGAMEGIAALSAFVIALYGLLLIIGSVQYAILEATGGEDVLSVGMDALVTVFSKLAEGLGSIISSFTAGLLEGLPLIGTILSDFMLNAEYFLSGLNNLDTAKADSVANLVSILASLFSGEFKIKDAEKNAKMYKKLAGNMNALLPELKSFADECAELKMSGVTKGSTAINALVTASKDIPNSGGLAGLFAGENSWDVFAKGLSEFGGAMVEFADVCADLNDDGMTKGCDATAQLSEVGDKIPNSGGIAGAIFGENGWDTFATGMTRYGQALKIFSEWGAHIKTDGITAGCDATAKLSEVADKIPNSGGVAAKLFGDNSWDKFQFGLTTYGTALSIFSTHTNNISVDAIRNACTATELLSDEYERLLGFPTSAQWGILIPDLVNYGKTLESFSDASLRTDWDLITRAAAATRSLAMALGSVEDNKLDTNSIKWDKVEENLTKFQKLLGSDITLIGNTLSQEASNGISRVRQYMVEIVESFGEIATYDDRISKLINTIYDVKDATNSISLGLLKAEFESLGKDMITGINAGFSTDESVLSTVRGVGTSMIAELRSALGIQSKTGRSLKMQTYGYYTVMGFADGVRNNVPKGSAAMAELGDSVLQAFRDRMGIHSPSKETEECGKQAVDGYTVGVEESQAKANATMTEFADGVITSTDNALSGTAEDTGKGWVENTVDAVVSKGGEIGGRVKDFFSNLITGNSQGILNSLGFDLNSLISGNFNVNDSDISKYFKDLNKDIKGYSFDSLLDTAKTEYDTFFEDYKQGKIDQAEYDRKYTELLKKYTNEQVGIISYGQDKMKDYLEDEFKDTNKTFEDNIKNIQTKMDNLTSGVVKSMDSAFTIKTNKEVYEEGLKDLQDRVDELTTKKDELTEKYGEENILTKETARNLEIAEKKLKDYEKAHEENTEEGYNKALAKQTAVIDKLEAKKLRMAKRYGEESREVKQVESQLKTANAELEKWKANHEVKKDDDIASINYAETFKDETIALTEYNKTVKSLKEKGASESVLEMLAGKKDIKEASAIATYLNNLTDSERKLVEGQYDIYKAAGNELANTFYGDDMEQAVLDYTNSIIAKWNELPESAKSIGQNMISSLALGFSEDTEASLAKIGESGESITAELKSIFGIHSPSRVMREEIGYNLADGLIQGFLDRLRAYTSMLTGEVLSDFSFDSDDLINIESFDGVLQSLTSAIQNRMDLEPTITPVLDMSQVNVGMEQWKTTMGMQTSSYLMNSAMTVNSSDASVITAINNLGSTLSSKLDTINPNPAIASFNSNVNSKLTELGTNISGINVVLDTGTLVGVMSSELGTASTMKVRGS